MNYEQDDKSLIRDTKATTQGIDFGGLVNGAASPTDIDAVLEYDDEILIIVEIKRKGNELSVGQGLVGTRITDAWVRAGYSRPRFPRQVAKPKKALFIFASHAIYDTNRNVMAAECKIERVYTPSKERDGDWTDGSDIPEKTLKDLLNRVGRNWECNKLKFE